VSGGNSPSLQDAIRTIDVSHHLEFIKKQEIKGAGKINNAVDDNTKYEPIDFKQAIYLEILGGAAALGKGEITGNFVVGNQFAGLCSAASISGSHMINEKLLATTLGVALEVGANGNVPSTTGSESNNPESLKEFECRELVNSRLPRPCRRITWVSLNLNGNCPTLWRPSLVQLTRRTIGRFGTIIGASSC
uniref:Uncharacterized protein n=1 Tax=Glossina morsitans morsitans TaxID=37546 RepID=A0A1B0FM04_GLOMM